MASLKLVLDTRRKRKDNLFPLVIRLSHQSATRDLPTHIKLKESSYNKRTSTIKGDEALNDEVQMLVLKYRNTLRTLMLEGNNLSIRELKERISQPVNNQITIKEYWQNEVERLQIINRAGGARIYRSVLSCIGRTTDLEIPFSSFTYEKLKQLDLDLYKQGLTVNGVAGYMRTFRAICNKAIKDDLVGYDWYPFRKYCIKTEKTASRAISIQEMKNYFSLNLSPDDTKYQSWCVGKLIFMLRGINVKDLLLLTDKNIVGDRLHYKRAKTGTIYSVKLLPPVLKIFSEFKGDTLLGRITAEELTQQDILMKRCMQNRKIINKHLKRIGVMLNLSQPLTTYTFRHSWASCCRKMGYSKELIGQGLGHATNSVTDTYLEQFDLELVDEMNNTVCSEVTGDI